MRKLFNTAILGAVLLGSVSLSYAQGGNKYKEAISTKDINKELVGMWQQLVPMPQEPSMSKSPQREQMRFVHSTIFKQINADGSFLNVTQNPRTYRMYGSVKGKWTARREDNSYKEEVQTHYLDKSLEGSSVSMKFELSDNGSILSLFIIYPNGSKSLELWKRVDLDPEIIDQMVSKTAKGPKTPQDSK